MATPLEEHPHFQLLHSESYESPTERAWLRWTKQVEKLLGHSLDGNQQRDGYSLDYAHDAFADGVSVTDYVQEVCADKAAIAAKASLIWPG
ncbi:hypothetical protein GMDG_08729 [Pseudogymnoascus destructans 20631-21]|uniref:Uncharacterized protein n=1 Tax=Pseudogymnoascus destructans (strain ATCC MYA-4855 / 20631-21) TaxID=658429 RepID=L8GC30_PSED2|nr:hypothetical protein GMDG_08729 [Pseudogymnoascus destructans 20631-21]